MKDALFLFLFAAFIFQSCGNDDDIPTCENCHFTCLEANDPDVITNNCIENWECEFKVLPNSKIDPEHNGGVADGNKQVFKMAYHTLGSPNIADDELYNTLLLELDESQTSFSVEDAALGDLNVRFRQVCFCPSVNFEPVLSGCLQGEEQEDGTWVIQGLLEANEWNTVKLEAVFGE